MIVTILQFPVGLYSCYAEAKPAWARLCHHEVPSSAHGDRDEYQHPGSKVLIPSESKHLFQPAPSHCIKLSSTRWDYNAIGVQTDIQNDDILPVFLSEGESCEQSILSICVILFLLHVCVGTQRCASGINPSLSAVDSTSVWRSWSFIYWQCRFLGNI